MPTKPIHLLKDKIPLLKTIEFQAENTIDIQNDNLIVVITFLKYHLKTQTKLLSCISGVDLMQTNYRFAVVYELLSVIYNKRIRVKAYINEVHTVDSLIFTIVSANWWEKEIWDMFGVFFLGHWGLRRLLTDYGFEGHPLRKDFPLIGFEEVQYDLTTKKVELASINLFQDIKLFQKETNSILY